MHMKKQVELPHLTLWMDHSSAGHKCDLSLIHNAYQNTLQHYRDLVTGGKRKVAIFSSHLYVFRHKEALCFIPCELLHFVEWFTIFFTSTSRDYYIIANARFRTNAVSSPLFGHFILKIVEGSDLYDKQTIIVKGMVDYKNLTWVFTGISPGMREVGSRADLSLGVERPGSNLFISTTIISAAQKYDKHQ